MDTIMAPGRRLIRKIGKYDCYPSQKDYDHFAREDKYAIARVDGTYLQWWHDGEVFHEWTCYMNTVYPKIRAIALANGLVEAYPDADVCVAQRCTTEVVWESRRPKVGD